MVKHFINEEIKAYVWWVLFETTYNYYFLINKEDNEYNICFTYDIKKFTR